MPNTPGLPNQDAIRNGSRAAGLILTPVGVLLVVVGFGLFLYGMVHAASSNDVSTGFPKACIVGFVLFAAGGFVSVMGRRLLGLGFLGAGARYVAGETAPAISTVAAAVRAGVQGEGAFCAGCGTRAAAGAAYCSKCGSALPG